MNVYILCIETSTEVCSAAISRNGELLDFVEETKGMSHAEKLMPLVKDLVERNNLSFGDLKAIAFAGGPGSYTGLRIGVSTAKGIGFAESIPIISIDSLLGIAAQIHSKIGSGALICPMIDARRMEVYAAVLDNNLKAILPTQPVIVDEHSFNQELVSNKVYFIGNGAEKCKELLGNNTNACFDKTVMCSAKGLVKIGFEKYQRGEFEDLAYYEPNYIKGANITKPKKLV